MRGAPFGSTTLLLAVSPVVLSRVLPHHLPVLHNTKTMLDSIRAKYQIHDNSAQEARYQVTALNIPAIVAAFQADFHKTLDTTVSKNGRVIPGYTEHHKKVITVPQRFSLPARSRTMVGLPSDAATLEGKLVDSLPTYPQYNPTATPTTDRLSVTNEHSPDQLTQLVWAAIKDENGVWMKEAKKHAKDLIDLTLQENSGVFREHDDVNPSMLLTKEYGIKLTHSSVGISKDSAICVTPQSSYTVPVMRVNTTCGKEIYADMFTGQIICIALSNPMNVRQFSEKSVVEIPGSAPVETVSGNNAPVFTQSRPHKMLTVPVSNSANIEQYSEKPLVETPDSFHRVAIIQAEQSDKKETGARHGITITPNHLIAFLAVIAAATTVLLYAWSKQETERKRLEAEKEAEATRKYGREYSTYTYRNSFPEDTGYDFAAQREARRKAEEERQKILADAEKQKQQILADAEKQKQRTQAQQPVAPTPTVNVTVHTEGERRRGSDLYYERRRREPTWFEILTETTPEDLERREREARVRILENRADRSDPDYHRTPKPRRQQRTEDVTAEEHRAAARMTQKAADDFHSGGRQKQASHAETHHPREPKW